MLGVENGNYREHSALGNNNNNNKFFLENFVLSFKHIYIKLTFPVSLHTQAYALMQECAHTCTDTSHY